MRAFFIVVCLRALTLVSWGTGGPFGFATRVRSLLRCFLMPKLTTFGSVSFFAGVMNVLSSALLLGFAPTWIPLFYTVQSNATRLLSDSIPD